MESDQKTTEDQTDDEMDRSVKRLLRAEIKRLRAFVEWVHLYSNDPEISAEAEKHMGSAVKS